MVPIFKMIVHLKRQVLYLFIAVNMAKDISLFCTLSLWEAYWWYGSIGGGVLALKSGTKMCRGHNHLFKAKRRYHQNCSASVLPHSPFSRLWKKKCIFQPYFSLKFLPQMKIQKLSFNKTPHFSSP